MRKQKVFRFSVTEDETHKQLKSWRFTRLGAILAAISAVIALVLLLYAVIALTPLRTTIPGYPDAHFRKQAISNAIKVDSLENAITRWKVYSENLSRVLAGEETLELDSLMKKGTTRYISEKSAEELARRDSALRAAVGEADQPSATTNPKSQPLEGISFFKPLKGTVSGSFDLEHPWIDITAPANSAVNAVLDGTVVFAGWDDKYGNTMIIQHSNNIISIYRHNSRLMKAVGDKVSAGTPIAIVGGTGSLDAGEHLHFELWYKGEAVDPAKYISF